jgi:threonine dehydrogenase-like Zn-dependent dehydrogenase
MIFATHSNRLLYEAYQRGGMTIERFKPGSPAQIRLQNERLCLASRERPVNIGSTVKRRGAPPSEIVGRVSEIGTAATKFRVGDFVAVGTMVDSCGECTNCKTGHEPYCQQGATWTYNAADRISGENTHGGYSDSIVVRKEFVLKATHDERDLYIRA